MKRKHKSKSFDERKRANERIAYFISRAHGIYKEDPTLAKRYCTLAKKIAMRYKVGIPKAHRRKLCKHCLTPMIPGLTCRVRLGGAKVIYFCFSCKNFMRIPYKPKRLKVTKV